jgi:hypothetical protein
MKKSIEIDKDEFWIAQDSGKVRICIYKNECSVTL